MSRCQGQAQDGDTIRDRGDYQDTRDAEEYESRARKRDSVRKQIQGNQEWDNRSTNVDSNNRYRRGLWYPVKLAIKCLFIRLLEYLPVLSLLYGNVDEAPYY